MRSTAPPSPDASSHSLLGMTLWPAPTASTETAPDVAVEIARLRTRLADDNARQHHCLAGAAQPL